MEKKRRHNNQLKRLTKRIFLFGRRYYYRGQNVACPICGLGFRKMLPGGFQSDVITEKEIIGAGLRDNNICPYCLSTDRDRLVFLYLKYKADIFNKRLKILHVSPEPALYQVISRIQGIDYTIGTKYAEGSYYPAEITFFDLTGMPHQDNTFDLVICNHVLEHIPNDLQAMQEIHRILKPGGEAILQVPISYKIEKTLEDDTVVTEADRHRIFGQFDHVRIYGPDYQQRLESVGFTVNVHHPGDENWPHEDITKYALNQKEPLFVAHKPKTKKEK